MKKDRALVIGGGLCGLLVAKVLADSYREVLILEKSSEERYSKGSPQSSHLHVMMAGGRRAIEKLLPGFDGQLAQAGAPEIDWASDTIWKGRFGIYPQYNSNVRSRSSSRELVDRLVRAHVLSLSNVKIAFDSPAERLAHAAHRVPGLQTGGTRPEFYAADLIVNAGGRTAGKLHAANTRRVDAELYYSSIRLASERPHLRQYYSQYNPRVRKGAVVTPIENGHFSLTCLTPKSDPYPRDFLEMRSLVLSLGMNDFSTFLGSCSPTSAVTHYGATASELRIPTQACENYLVVGDALSATNPTYGQGMSAAALAALQLAAQLRRGKLDQRKFNRMAAKIFSLTASEDLKLAIDQSHLGFALRSKLSVRAVGQRLLLQLAQRNRSAHKLFLNVLHLNN